MSIGVHGKVKVEMNAGRIRKKVFNRSVRIKVEREKALGS
jgi:hypothetical protein